MAHVVAANTGRISGTPRLIIRNSIVLSGVTFNAESSATTASKSNVQFCATTYCDKRRVLKCSSRPFARPFGQKTFHRAGYCKDGNSNWGSSWNEIGIPRIPWNSMEFQQHLDYHGILEIHGNSKLVWNSKFQDGRRICGIGSPWNSMEWNLESPSLGYCTDLRHPSVTSGYASVQQRHVYSNIYIYWRELAYEEIHKRHRISNYTIVSYRKPIQRVAFFQKGKQFQLNDLLQSDFQRPINSLPWRWSKPKRGPKKGGTAYLARTPVTHAPPDSQSSTAKRGSAKTHVKLIRYWVLKPRTWNLPFYFVEGCFLRFN